MNNFKTIGKLGEGAFSTVYKVKRISDGMDYALKKVQMGKLSSKEKENALNEVRILASVVSENIIQYKESFFDDHSGCLCIVMELCDGGDLLKKIETYQKLREHPKENQIWKYFFQMIRGLKSLHEAKIVHRDIKCANVFLMKSGELKLGDLNVSKIAKHDQMLVT